MLSGALRKVLKVPFDCSPFAETLTGAISKCSKIDM